MPYRAQIILLKLTYKQIQINEKFEEVTTINTPIPIRWTRMLYGIKTASSIFQRPMVNILSGEVENMIIYQDDIYIGTSSKKELEQKTEDVLNKLKKSLYEYKPR